LAENHQEKMKVFSKIEKKEAIENLDEIVDISD
jgi:pyruvate kinase